MKTLPCPSDAERALKTSRSTLPLVALLAAVSVAWAATDSRSDSAATAARAGSCFLLYEIGVGELRRSPATVCRSRVSPASTFKIPHALFALDAGVIAGPEEKLAYDGGGDWPEPSRRDHTLASAIRYSVVWYFQKIALRLGADRESAYLHRLSYGNMDSSSGLTTFWLGGSLEISPDEQEQFLVKLYGGDLPFKKSALRAVRAMLIEPQGVVVNAQGEQPFAAPWPADAVVSAKPGRITDQSGRGARWLVGHVQRGRREFIFVSCVIGAPTIEQTAALTLAAESLRQEHVL